jgi:hypothetical protein
MKLKSPAFSNFRYWMDVWDEAVDNNRIKELIEGNNFVFFFKYNKEIFGAPEESRLTFAKMKNPDKDMPTGWAKEANFMALNFNKALQGDTVRAIFNIKDINSIEILSQEQAEKDLTKVADQIPQDKKKYSTRIIMVPSQKTNEPDKAFNMKNLGEK